MDYLLRDSLYCGVQYGRYDLDRLRDTMLLYGGSPDIPLQLAVDDGGIRAIEGFILARYFMFTQVYFHDVRRAYDYILEEFIRGLLEDQYGQGQYPEDVGQYVTWDDTLVLSRGVSLLDRTTKNWAYRLIERQHPKAIYDTGPHPDALCSIRALKELPKRIEEQFPGILVWADQALDHPEKVQRVDLPVRLGENVWSWHSIMSESKVLDGLQVINQVRVYADVRGDKNLEDSIERFCKGLMV